VFILGFIGFVSAVDEAQISEDEAEKEATYDLEKSADLSQFYTRGRFLLNILSFFKGGTCGDKICGIYEYSCFEDCGKIVAKNNWIHGDVYSGESSYDGIDYQFQVTGKCEALGTGTTLREKDLEGAVIRDVEVAIRYDGKEEAFQIGDREEFTLKNGKTFYVNSQMCELLGFVDVALTNPVCGDGACWSESEIACPQDCGFFWVGFQQDDAQTPIKLEYVCDGYNQTSYSGFYKDDTHTPIKTEVEYNGYNYSFEFTAVQKVRHLTFVNGKDYGYIVQNEDAKSSGFANLSVTYFPVNNPSLKVVKDITLIGSPIADFSLNGLNFRVSLPVHDNKAVKLKLRDNFHVATFQFIEP